MSLQHANCHIIFEVYSNVGSVPGMTPDLPPLFLLISLDDCHPNKIISMIEHRILLDKYYIIDIVEDQFHKIGDEYHDNKSTYYFTIKLRRNIKKSCIVM